MRMVQIDFIRRRDGSHLFGIAVLLIGLIAVFVLSNVMYRTDDERSRLEGKLWKMRAPAYPNDKNQINKSQAQTTALMTADQLIAQFRRPWDQLFASLEGIGVKGVRLHQITPQTGGVSRVQLIGEADEGAALYEYMRRMRDTGNLRDIILLQQHWDEESKTVQFQILANWENMVAS